MKMFSTSTNSCPVKKLNTEISAVSKQTFSYYRVFLNFRIYLSTHAGTAVRTF